MSHTCPPPGQVCRNQLRGLEKLRYPCRVFVGGRIHFFGADLWCCLVVISVAESAGPDPATPLRVASPDDLQEVCRYLSIIVRRPCMRERAISR